MPFSGYAAPAQSDAARSTATMRPSRATLHPGLGPREDDGEDEREQRPAHRCLPRGPRAQPPPERVVSDPLLGEADGDGVGSCRVCCEVSRASCSSLLSRRPFTLE